MAEGGDMSPPDFFTVPPNQIYSAVYFWHTGRRNGNEDEHIANCAHCSEILKNYGLHQRELREQNEKEYQEKMAKLD